jgi:hypothetical protein
MASPEGEGGTNAVTACQVAPRVHATSVPVTAVPAGLQRTTTDNSTAASTCAGALSSQLPTPADLALGAGGRTC